MIPYTTEPRADTRVTNVTMGIWLFLASEVMLFGALFSSYALLRVAAGSWPVGREVLSLPLGAANTVVLLLMTAAAWRARSSPAQRTTWLGISSALAVVFLGIKGFEYWDEIDRGLLPRASTFLAMYFTLTGLHAAHVVGGLIANIWVIAGARRVTGAMTTGRLRALGLYWGFVDLVWLVIFVLFYLT